MGCIKRDKFDAVVSDLVRERADYICERCGKWCRDQWRMDCSHYMGRRNMATRWDTDNCAALCFVCHQKVGENPPDHVAWFIATRGEGMEQIVREKAHGIRKWSKAEKEVMYQYYKAELKRLREMRANGVTGWIDVVSYC